MTAPVAGGPRGDGEPGEPDNHLGREAAWRLRFPGLRHGRMRTAGIGSVSDSSTRFVASISRPVVVRRALAAPSVTVSGVGSAAATVAAPRWWYPSAPDGEPEPPAALQPRDLPARGLPRAARQIPNEQTWTPGGFAESLKSSEVRVRRYSEVSAAGNLAPVPRLGAAAVASAAASARTSSAQPASVPPVSPTSVRRSMVPPAPATQPVPASQPVPPAPASQPAPPAGPSGAAPSPTPARSAPPAPASATPSPAPSVSAPAPRDGASTSPSAARTPSEPSVGGTDAPHPPAQQWRATPRSGRFAAATRTSGAGNPDPYVGAAREPGSLRRSLEAPRANQPGRVAVLDRAVSPAFGAAASSVGAARAEVRPLRRMIGAAHAIRPRAHDRNAPTAPPGGPAWRSPAAPRSEWEALPAAAQPPQSGAAAVRRLVPVPATASPSPAGSAPPASAVPTATGAPPATAPAPTAPALTATAPAPSAAAPGAPRGAEPSTPPHRPGPGTASPPAPPAGLPPGTAAPGQAIRGDALAGPSAPQPTRDGPVVRRFAEPSGVGLATARVLRSVGGAFSQLRPATATSALAPSPAGHIPALPRVARPAAAVPSTETAVRRSPSPAPSPAPSRAAASEARPARPRAGAPEAAARLGAIAMPEQFAVRRSLTPAASRAADPAAARHPAALHPAGHRPAAHDPAALQRAALRPAAGAAQHGGGPEHSGAAGRHATVAQRSMGSGLGSVEVISPSTIAIGAPPVPGAGTLTPVRRTVAPVAPPPGPARPASMQPAATPANSSAQGPARSGLAGAPALPGAGGAPAVPAIGRADLSRTAFAGTAFAAAGPTGAVLRRSFVVAPPPVGIARRAPEAAPPGTSASRAPQQGAPDRSRILDSAMEIFRTYSDTPAARAAAAATAATTGASAGTIDAQRGGAMSEDAQVVRRLSGTVDQARSSLRPVANRPKDFLGADQSNDAGGPARPVVASAAPMLDPRQLDELVDQVVDRIEQRVVDELERRGRYGPLGGM